VVLNARITTLQRPAGQRKGMQKEVDMSIFDDPGDLGFFDFYEEPISEPELVNDFHFPAPGEDGADAEEVP